jgi:formylglycine-generating enzyme required for sulfatase activity
MEWALSKRHIRLLSHFILNLFRSRVYREKKSFMKLLLAFCLSLFSLVALAESPEPIAPKTKVIRSIQWYLTQSKLWQERIGTQPGDASAWFNYYSASRYAQKSQQELDEIAATMQEAVPGSAEALTVSSWNKGYTEDSFKLIQKAYTLKPESNTTYGMMTLFHEFSLDEQKRTEFSKRLLGSGLVSEALMSYSYNVLMSMDSKAVLFTEGENTTLPLFILQDVMNIRRDVTILNLDLLNSKGYRDRKLKVAGLTFNEANLWTELDQRQSICTLLPGQNKNYNFYYALTVSRESISSIKDHLYVVGLASQLSTARLDNISVIKENLEKKFLLDYLTVDFNGENEFSAGRVLSVNYLVPMLLLNDHYVKTGEKEKARKLEALVAKLASESGKMDLVESFLHRDKDPERSFILVKINAKPFDESVRLIRGNLYAFNTEVTNEQYNSFLEFLTKNNETDAYEKSKIDLSRYDKEALTFFKGYHTYFTANKGKVHDAFRKYPVVNISYEGAVTYCEWLTQQYNATPERKFKKVKFRLPTLNEWQIAALGNSKFQSWTLKENTIEVIVPSDTLMEIAKGEKKVIPVDDKVLYPWWGSYNYRAKAQNRRNCWLGNFKVPDYCKPCQIPKMGGDGWIMHAPTATYFPNNIGLYDVVGNVAEMIDEKGKACGGSWNHLPSESTIHSINAYSGPDGAVGFRIFMEVIEP